MGPAFFAIRTRYENLKLFHNKRINSISIETKLLFIFLGKRKSNLLNQ